LPLSIYVAATALAQSDWKKGDAYEM